MSQVPINLNTTNITENGARFTWEYVDGYGDLFVFEVQTTGTDDTFTIPTTGAGYDCEVLWGDGSDWEAFSGTAPAISHQYADEDLYEIRIRGDFPRIYFNYTGHRDKMVSIKHWGSQKWTSMERAFEGCRYMNVVAEDDPDLSLASTILRMFHGCEHNLDFSANHWDVSNISNISWAFRYTREFNSNLGNWDTSEVTDMSYMFNMAYKFNNGGSDSIGNWDVSKVKNMHNMFAESQFNQDISEWNTASLENLQGTFMCVFNQNINTKLVNEGTPEEYTAWDTSNVTNMSYTFKNNSAFKQDISGWNFEKVTTFVEFLNVANINATGTTTNYDKLLISIASQNVNNSLSFHGGTSKYSDGDGEPDKTTNAEFARWSLIAVHDSALADEEGTDKSTYDDEAVGFQFWDTSAERIWIKRTAGSADWIGPFNLGKSWTITDGGLAT